MSGYTEIALLQYELEKLRAELAKKDAKIERLKTVPMMYRRMAFNAQLQDENAELQQQLAALKTGLHEICAAIDDPACDLTLTTVECIKKLKAENESLKLDAERWRAYQKRKQDLLDRGFLRSPLREEAELNPAMAQGEK